MNREPTHLIRTLQKSHITWGGFAPETPQDPSPCPPQVVEHPYCRHLPQFKSPFLLNRSSPLPIHPTPPWKRIMLVPITPPSTLNPQPSTLNHQPSGEHPAHEAQCPQEATECPNPGCGATITRGSAGSHLSTACPKERVRCTCPGQALPPSPSNTPPTLSIFSSPSHSLYIHI